MKTHFLKIKDCYLERLKNKTKTHEIRFNDRDYQVGDQLLFSCKNAQTEFIYTITHILNSSQFPEGLKDNYVILSLKLITK